MESLYIKGGHSLDGKLDVATAKNALLPILACAISSNDVIKICKVSFFTDVIYMIKILESLGCKLKIEKDDVIIDPTTAKKYFVSEEYTKKVRSSIFMLGPLLSRFKKAKVAYPGGCNIGNRPIDLHLKGLRELNVIIEEKHGYIECDGSNMKSGEIHLDFPSVGATENLIMASVFLKGTTTIHNAAREPEIEDLQNFINAMGGKIAGGGTSTIVVKGVKKLHGCEYLPITDRIVAGTYLIACAMVGGHIEICNTSKTHNFPLITKLSSIGCEIKTTEKNLIMRSSGRLKSIESIDTQPYPGFPTDLQSQILTLQTISDGTSMITENLFETRFKIVNELIKMGANITIKNQTAVVKGVKNLYGARVTATDLRGGAGLVIAGLAGIDYTIVEDIYHIDRGYLNIEKDLQQLGADIKRIDI